MAAAKTREITVGKNAAAMSLHFDDADPVSRCHVMTTRPELHGQRSRGLFECRWHAHGDSVNDAIAAWAEHLSQQHKGGWE